MSRYISKLPEPIRALAEKRREECKDTLMIKNDVGLVYAFNWEMTPEKTEFWYEIFKENYSVFYDLYPQKDKLDELIGNELWSTLLVNALRGLTQEQQAGLCIDLYDRNENKEKILEIILNTEKKDKSQII